MRSDAPVLLLEDCTGDCVQLVGGKAVGLGALLHAGLRVPPGFVITTAAYRDHVERNGLAAEVERILSGCTTYEAQLQASEEIRRLFDASAPSEQLADDILRAYAALGKPPVAVRSSANAEDTANASYAG